VTLTLRSFRHPSRERSTKSGHFLSAFWIGRREQPGAVGVTSIVTFAGSSSPCPAMLHVKATESVERWLAWVVKSGKDDLGRLA
jgi:hypothetical protein